MRAKKHRHKNIMIIALGLIYIVLILCGFGYFHEDTNIKIELDPGKKLDEIIWLNDDFWYTCTEMRESDYPETHCFETPYKVGLRAKHITIIERREP